MCEPLKLFGGTNPQKSDRRETVVLVRVFDVPVSGSPRCKLRLRTWGPRKDTPSQLKRWKTSLDY